MSWSRRNLVCGVGAGVAMLARSVRADAPMTVRLGLSTARARVGSGFHLQVEVVRRDGGQVPDPVLPQVLGDDNVFVVEGPDVSQGFVRRSFNGQSTAEVNKKFTYVVIPRRAGRFELEAHVGRGSGRVRSNVVVLEVDGQTTPQPEAPGVGKPEQPAGNLFLWATVDHKRAYVGQQVTYRLDVYERSAQMKVNLRKLPSFQDFWSVELPEDAPSTELVAGVPYTVHPGLHRALFPQKAGRLTIGAADATVEQRPSLFQLRREAPQHVAGSPIDVEVLPLPAEGQPPGFSPNNVGRYSIEASVDQTSIEQGRPFTLTVTIEGAGNLKFLDPGQWPELRGARRYDPKEDTELFTSTTVSGRRRYSFLVIPERAGALTIPAHTLTFFDPEQEKYETARTEPIELIVERGSAATGSGEDLDVDAGDPSGEFAGSDELAALFVADALPRHEPRPPWLTARRWAYGMVAAPATLGVIAGAGLLWRRLGPGEEARARANERAHRRARLASARDAVASGEGFHATLSGLMHDIAVAQAGPDGVGLPRPELLALLEERGSSTDVLDRLRELLDRCDMARFATSAGTAEERARLLQEAEALTRDLGRGGSK